MTFHFAPAVRDKVGLLILIAGVSGSGKTLSALKIARGLVGGDDGKVAFIDTEAGRGKHYSPAPGEAAGPNRFAFAHGDLRPPFSPAEYRAAIEAADAAGYEAIIVDSASHVWEGEGGAHDMHEAALSEQVEAARKNHKGDWAFDEGKTRERLSVGAWRKPKAEHKKFVTRLLQTRAHLILCMRADEKMRIEKVKDDRGRERTVIVQAKDLPPVERWSPICEKRLPYEMVLSFVLAPDRPGVPIPIKLQEQHRAAVPLDRPLSEDTGRALAQWARGGQAADQPASPALRTSGEAGETTDLDAARIALQTSAQSGVEALRMQFQSMPKLIRAALEQEKNRLKPIAEQADLQRAEA